MDYLQGVMSLQKPPDNDIEGNAISVGERKPNSGTASNLWIDKGQPPSEMVRRKILKFLV